jgi:carbon monoxide dehydrogenase subunit G
MDGYVSRYKPGERLEMIFTDKMFDVLVVFAVAPSGTGSKVTVATEITPKGFMAKMMSGMIAKGAAGQMAKDVAKLKECLGP